MSLKLFHIVFITCSSLLAFLVGGWGLAQGGGYLAMGIVSFLFGFGMIAYGFWFWRKIRTPGEEQRRRRRLIRTVTVVSTLILLAGSRDLWACAVCYGEAEGPMIEAAKMGVFLLYGMVLAVQLALGGFFLYLRRRSRIYNGNVAPWWNDVEEAHEP